MLLRVVLDNMELLDGVANLNCQLTVSRLWPIIRCSHFGRVPKRRRASSLIISGGTNQVRKYKGVGNHGANTPS